MPDPVVHLDQINAAAITDSLTGIELPRGGKVTGLTGNALEKVSGALVALTTAGHGVGSDVVLPNSLGSVFLRRRRVKAITTDTVEVELEYSSKPVDQPVFEGSIRLVQKTTYKNRDGSQITVSHNGQTQGCGVSVLVPQITLRISRVEEGVQPLPIARAIAGMLNEGNWVGAQDKWMCTGVSFRSDDYGANWSMVYEMSDDPDGEWQPIAVFRDEGGQIPAGLVDGQGIKTIEWYRRKRYQDLGL